MLNIVLFTFSILIIGVLAFIKFSPQFGGKPTKEILMRYATSSQFRNGKFFNTQRINMSLSGKDMFKILKQFLFPIPNTRPKLPLPIVTPDQSNLTNHQNKTQLIWFGHSAFLLQINNKNILIDPMFGRVPAPHPLLGQNRFNTKLPIEIEKLPKIDAVVLSHDHYDHLDYGSIMKLKDKVDQYFVPLGVGNHLRSWKIDDSKINELDWWESTSLGTISLHCTPAQHFSGRGLTDRAKTLWCSWVINTENDNIFFSGDSGYAPHFKEIGNRFGPFDIALMECGQYNELWHDIHMLPEETVQAAIDVRANKFMAIHWAAFKLALHTWTDPIERVFKEAKRLKVELITPKIGEIVALKDDWLHSTWWK